MLENLKVKLQTRTYPCAVRTFYNTLSEADQQILMDVLCDSSISDNGLSRALKEQTETRLSDTSIARHRRGLCSCSRI